MTALRHSHASASPSLELDAKSGQRALSVDTLSLHHFRNYYSVRLEGLNKIVVLSGRNGAGKTNILEALSLLTPGRGLRKAKLSDLNQAGQLDAWTIAAQINGIEGPTQLGTARTEDEGGDKRLVKIDGKIRPQADLSTHLAMLWLTPQMEQLFLESASSGRKFLDRLVYSFDPAHATRVNAYEQLMRDRNRLLETGQGDRAWLDSLEQKMAENASAIAYARLDTIAHLNHTIASSKRSFPKAQLSVEGVAENRLQAGDTAIIVEEALRELWAQERAKDAAAGRTLQGAHRSELRVFHVEKQMAAEACSTGEQKALLLSIVLSQAHTTAHKKGVVPILLFDEISAHLDAIRRLELFEEICQIGAQTWMTGTDVNLFAEIREKTTFLHIENGNVTAT